MQEHVHVLLFVFWYVKVSSHLTNEVCSLPSAKVSLLQVFKFKGLSRTTTTMDSKIFDDSM